MLVKIKAEQVLVRSILIQVVSVFCTNILAELFGLFKWDSLELILLTKLRRFILRGCTALNYGRATFLPLNFLILIEVSLTEVHRWIIHCVSKQ